MSQTSLETVMPKIRSSTIFRLLCASIGILAVSLLAMAALMVYPYVAGGDDGAPAAPGKTKPPTTKVRQINVKTAAGAWQENFWPEVTEDQQEAPVANTQDAAGDFIYIGSMIISERNRSAIFQRKSNREQFRVSLGNEKYEVTLKEVSPEQVVATVAGNLVALRKVNALPVKGAKKSSGKRPRTQPRSASTTVNSSYRLAQSRAGSGPTRVTAVRSGASRTSPRSGTTRTTSGSSSRSSTNWRQYWADRMRNRRQPQR